MTLQGMYAAYRQSFDPEREPCMKFNISPVTAIFLALAMAASALAQDFVSERSVRLSAMIFTQGPDASVTTVTSGTTITTKRVVTTTFGNRDLLGMMIGRQLIPAPLADWDLIFLADKTGTGRFYAGKAGLPPVLVPADLLTVPEFGAKVAGGMTVTGAEGGNFGGLTETSFASLAVGGVTASGLATSGGANNGDQGHSVSPDSATTTLTFAGGAVDADGDRLVKGVIVIGSAKSITMDAVPVK